MTKTTHLGAPIIDFDLFDQLRPQLGKIVATSGPFDPIHPGHISCILASKKFGDTLVVIVNGDGMLKMKKGKHFQNLATRSMIVSAIREVNFVIPFEIEGDMTVIKALERVRPHVFTKGGDRRDKATIPEWEVCQKHGIDIQTGVGLDKLWSSSDFLREWEEHYTTQQGLLDKK
jgi:cytidyltransferase-like protein